MPPADAKPLVLVAEPIDAACIAWLAERADVRTIAASEAEFGEALGACEGLVVRTYVCVDGALLARAPRLRVVGRAGVGLDNIDQEACARRGVRIVSTPGANTQSVVEYVLGSILDHVRPRPTLDRALAQDEWSRARAAAIAPHELPELTLGILGLGRIGSAVARAASALGMPTVFHDLIEIAPGARHGAAPVGMDELMARSDVLSIHVDGRTSNRALVGTALLARARPGLLLINTSRGTVVDAPALAAFLRAHPDARAVLDVHDPEPITPDNPLLGMVQARLTPHIASATRTAKRTMSWVVRDLWDALSG